MASSFLGSYSQFPTRMGRRSVAWEQLDAAGKITVRKSFGCKRTSELAPSSASWSLGVFSLRIETATLQLRVRCSNYQAIVPPQYPYQHHNHYHHYHHCNNVIRESLDLGCRKLSHLLCKGSQDSYWKIIPLLKQSVMETDKIESPVLYFHLIFD